MLEHSQHQWDAATPAERDKAEAFAAAYLAAEMEQDLIPAEEARSKIGEHRAAATKEWRRSAYAALVGLRAVGA